jgi:hypothetical protein
MKVTGQIHAPGGFAPGGQISDIINLLKPSGNFTYHQV